MKSCVAFTLLIALPAVAAEVDSRTGLVMNPGWEQVRAHCGGCHSFAIVTSQRASRERWTSMIRWMQESQNLWQFEPEVETQILDYLAATYAPQPNRRRPPIPPHLRPPTRSTIQ